MRIIISPFLRIIVLLCYKKYHCVIYFLKISWSSALRGVFLNGTPKQSSILEIILKMKKMNVLKIIADYLKHITNMNFINRDVGYRVGCIN